MNSCLLSIVIFLSLSALCIHAKTNETSTTNGSGTSSSLSTGFDSSTTGSSTSGSSTTGDIIVKVNSTGNATGCGEHLTCGDCTGDLNCVWCQSSSSCEAGHWYGASQSCSDWRWKQCEINGKYALLGAVGALGLLILILLLCVCCCCCCAKKNKKNKKHLKDFKEFKAIQLEEEKENLVSKTPKTDSRRAELSKKYSSKLGSSGNSINNV